MTSDFEKAHTHAQLLIRFAHEKNPDKDMSQIIREQVDMVLSIKPEWESSVDKGKLVKDLETIFSTWIGEARTLEGNDTHKPWLHERRTDIDWRYWTRYKQFLQENGWADVDFLFGLIAVNRSLHVLKGSKVVFRQPKTASGRRSIALPPSALLMLTEYRKAKEAEALLLDMPIQDSDLVFGTLGKPLLPNSVSHAWGKLIAKTGLKAIRLHDARHTHASLMLKQGIHPKIVQERLGHSSIQIT